MAQITNVLIGIQARSTSKRFPRKVFETIGGKPMIQHVIDACDRSAKYMNNHSLKTGTHVYVALLVPKGDELAQSRRFGRLAFEGPEDDVLTRYQMAAKRYKADYIVRVTGDCPLIPPYLITKHIKTAVVNGYDYVSNVDESHRTSADGTDCEVISDKLLDYVHANTRNEKDREHVTTFIRRECPDWAKVGHVVGHLNLSALKLSVDTQEDLERVRTQYDILNRAIETAEAKSGKFSVHRF